jgi:hypothetical protein
LAFIPLTQLNKPAPPVELWLSLNKATAKPATVRLAMTPAFAKLMGPDVGVGTNMQLSLGVGEDAGLGLLAPGDGPKLRSQNKRLDCSCAQIPPAPIDGPAGERWTLQNVARSNTLVKHELRPEGVVFTIPREWWTIERDAAGGQAGKTTASATAAGVRVAVQTADKPAYRPAPATKPEDELGGAFSPPRRVAEPPRPAQTDRAERAFAMLEAASAPSTSSLLDGDLIKALRCTTAELDEYKAAFKAARSGNGKGTAAA